MSEHSNRSNNNYIALYRKWRPRVFEDVVEQEHVVLTLRNSVNSGRLAHAYLFSGTRGTGKTTMAHILSRAINCLSPVNGDPCNQCERCKEILSGSSTDILEIDAASNNGVDSMREIRDEVIYAPSKAKYKVYIIDEVHMLSTGAFNALLKTLEEPPSHVVFILATTEPHKLPATVISRCQRFDFRRITVSSIVERLKEITASGGVTIQDDAARLIAKISDGALRDAISLLDQCISVGREEITYADVLSIVGIVNDSFMTGFAEYILQKDTKSLLENINTLVIEGKDIGNFLSDLIAYFRNLLICTISSSPTDIIDVPEDMLKTMKEQAGSSSAEYLINLIKELSALENSIKWSGNPRIMLEVGIIKLCNNIFTDPSESSGKSDESAVSDLKNRISQLEQKILLLEKSSRAPVVSASQVVNNNPAIPEPIDEPEITFKEEVSQKDTKAKNGISKLAKVDNNNYFDKWDEVLNELKNLGRVTIFSYLMGTKAILQDNDTVSVVFNDKNNHGKKILTERDNLTAIEEAIKKVTSRQVSVRYIDEDKIAPFGTNTEPSKIDSLEEKARKLADAVGSSFEVIDE